MLTLTVSSIPSARYPPIDHIEAIHKALSKDGVRDELRNTMEYHLNLEPEQWIYWSPAEPNGMGAPADTHKNPGANACYTHHHVVIYIDISALDPTIYLEDIGGELERIINRHIEICDPASFEAHDYTAIDLYVIGFDG